MKVDLETKCLFNVGEEMRAEEETRMSGMRRRIIRTKCLNRNKHDFDVF